MNLNINGRVAMIAAASKGLGKACALALAKEGCKVSISSRSKEEIERAAKEIGAHGEVFSTTCDISNNSDIERWYQETTKAFGKVDILVTNTGGPPVSRFMNLTDEQWVEGVQSTLMNVIRLTRLVVPKMKEQKWGRIIHLTSLVAKQPSEELTISSTLRAGLSGLTKTMADQFGPDGITVNAILTGHIMTDRQTHLAEVRSKEKGISSEAYLVEHAKSIPLKRIGEPSELGDVVAFLASERASYLTGVSLPVDGGIIRASM